MNRAKKGELLWEKISIHYYNARYQWDKPKSQRHKDGYFSEVHQLSLLIKKAQSRIKQLQDGKKITLIDNKRIGELNVK